MKTAPFCPSMDMIHGLMKGTLQDIDPDSMGQHILECSECQSKISDWIKKDPFVADLKSVHKLPTESYRSVVQQILQRVRPRAQKAPAAPKADLSFLAPAHADHADDLGMLDRYRIVNLLGQGGMGMVFRAVDPSLERMVALKIILPQYASNEQLRKRFISEARATVAVRSAHVAEVYDCGEWNNVPYLTMELLSGESLDKRPMPMPVDVWRRIGFGITKGLADAHSYKIIHRDLKPGNIHLGKDARTGKPTVKLIDFGLARPIERAEELTRTGSAMGTPLYMSPEQAAGKKVDHRTDLYALGIILFQLATGKYPYQNVNQGAFALITELASPEPLPDVRTLAPNVPEILAKLISRLMDKNPEHRPASADEVLAIFKQSVDVAKPMEPGAAVAVSTPYITATPIPSDTVEYQNSRPVVPVESWAFEPSTSRASSASVATVAPIMTTPSERTPPPRRNRTLIFTSAILGVALAGGLTAFALGAFDAEPEPPKQHVKKEEPPVIPVIPEPVKAEPDDWPPLPEEGKTDPRPFQRPIFPKRKQQFPRGNPNPVPRAVTYTLVFDISEIPLGASVLLDGQPVPVQWDRERRNGQVRVQTTYKQSYVLSIRLGIREIRRASIVPAIVPEEDEVLAIKPDAIHYDKIDDLPANLNTYLITGGTWQRTSDELFLYSHDNHTDPRIVLGDARWTDYVYRLDLLQASSATTGCSICFRSSGLDGEYRLVFPEPGQTRCQLVRIERDGSTRVLSTWNYQLQSDRWYSLTIRAVGSQLTGSIQEPGQPSNSLFTLNDAAVASGAIGLTVPRTGYRFRKITLTTPDGSTLWDGLPRDDTQLRRVTALPSHLQDANASDFQNPDWYVESDRAGSRWTVKDNTIVGENPSNQLVSRSYLLSKKDYGDFRLKMEYQLEIGSIAGITIRATPDEQLPGPFNLALRDHPIVRLASALSRGDTTGTAHFLTNEPKIAPKISLAMLDRNTHTCQLDVRKDEVSLWIDGKMILNEKQNPKIVRQLAYSPALERKQGRVGFQINAGRMTVTKLQIQELDANGSAVGEAAAPTRVNPVPQVPVADPFKADSTWRGVKILDRGTEVGQTSFYELYIESRDGSQIAGTIVENGLTQRTLKVIGRVNQSKIEWKEIDPTTPTQSISVSGAFTNGILSLDIADGNRTGKAKLFRTRLASGDTFEEFYPIFNGRNLDAWWSTDTPEARFWEVTKSGTLSVRGERPAQLFSKFAFEDVHVWCRCRINSGGQGGVFVRAGTGSGSDAAPEGYQAIVASGIPKRETGSLQSWEKFEPTKLPGIVKPNQWFDLEILVRGDRVEIRVNDKESVSFKDISKRPASGRIALYQADAKSKIEFAMIAVKELKAK